ncbi:MAG: hypothetical protein HYV90_03140 [Candidatus Woesebacteria bacterium]|nr:MAG: hypothetical protein HYV90_03140 [Candidatus Woesebacteria bacterium]
MKFFIKSILFILFIPVFLIAVIAGIIKYQLLDPYFWQGSFDRGNVYSGLSQTLKTYTVKQIVREGGNTTDARVLTDLINPANIKDLIDRNVINILSFANGQAREITVYIPISKFPKGFVPKDLGINELTPLSTILSKFNIPINRNQIQWISIIGKTSSFLLMSSVAILVICLCLFFVLTDAGKRLTFAGVTILLIGILSLSIWKQIGSYTGNLAGNLQAPPVLEKQIVAIVTQPVLAEIAKTWFLVGVTFTIFGIALFFIKKPEFGAKKSGV